MDALGAAIKVYKGKPLINSVTGEEHSLANVLHLVKELGVNITLGGLPHCRRS